MLNFNEIDVDIETALKLHTKHILKTVKNQLEKRKCSLLIEFLEIIKPDNEKTIEGSLKKIIQSKPKEIYEINEEFLKFIDSKSTTHFDNITFQTYINTRSIKAKIKLGNINQFISLVEDVFSYSRFGGSEYTKYNFTQNLNVRTCMYCNRMYAITHYKAGNSTLMNPQIDHWLPQSKYPLFQVSFYNLIPSCEICNARIKKEKEFIEKEHVHPHDDSYEELKFTYLFKDDMDSLKVIFDNKRIKNKVRDTFEYMFIDEMYNAHIPELKDLIKIKEVYGSTYLNKLADSFPNLNISINDRYRLAFGVELDPRKFHLYPLSKFKYDILKELGIIIEE